MPWELEWPHIGLGSTVYGKVINKSKQAHKESSELEAHLMPNGECPLSAPVESTAYLPRVC